MFNHIVTIKILVLSMLMGITSSCTKNLEVIQVEEYDTFQTMITQLHESRVQIVGFEHSGNQLMLKLKDVTLKLNTKHIPFINIDKQGRVSVNGHRFANKITRYLNGRPNFPNISMSENRYLIVNGLVSNYKCDFFFNKEHSKDLSIIAIAKLDSYVCFYNASDKIVIPIADDSNYLIPEYFFDRVIEKELLGEETGIENSPEDKFSYVFFTDAHWGKNQQHSPAIIKHIVDYSNIDCVIYGGDANTHHTETVKEALEIGFKFKESFDFLGSRLLAVFGNHDDNSTGQPSRKDRHLSEEQVYSFLQSQMTNVIYGDYYNFYYDDPISKTRFICIDTGRYYDSSFRDSMPKTAQFLIECLSGIQADWHIVIVSHIWLTLVNFNTGEAEEAPYLRPLIEVLENYNLRVKSEFSYGDKNIPYDFTDARSVIEYCIGGHIHTDAMVLSKRGIPIITITCDGQQEVAGGGLFDSGTINEQAVTIVVNDYNCKEVQMYRIGRGEDWKVNMWTHK